jgi:hypothetical protein
MFWRNTSPPSSGSKISLAIKPECRCRVKNFYFFRLLQAGSGAHAASYAMRTGNFFSGVKRQERKAGHIPPTNSEIKKTGSSYPLLHTLSSL